MADPGKRAAILDAAQRLSAESADFSIEQLLKEAGAGIGTFYHHFPNGRDDLERALRESASADYEDGLLKVLRRNRAAEPAVKALVHHHVRWTADQPEVGRVALAGWAGPSRELLREVRGWAAAAGLVAAAPDLLLAAALGPIREWSRSGGGRRSESAVEKLAEASWAAIRALAGLEAPAGERLQDREQQRRADEGDHE